MKNRATNRSSRPGYVSYLMVLTMAITLLAMMINSYKNALAAQESQASTSLRVDYQAKEEGVLRALVPITINRAMRAMQQDSADGLTEFNSSKKSYPLRWQRIFRESIDQANGGRSVDSATLTQLNLTGRTVGNSGDSSIGASSTFSAYGSAVGYARPGINADLGPGFPVPLETTNTDIQSRDHTYPIISFHKQYGGLADGRVEAPPATYQKFNLIRYPNIRFGYANPGALFVAKRNWWAFSMDLADQDEQRTGAATKKRDFVISIYEVPSQLAISAEAFTVLGQYEDGTKWENATIDGGVFATRASVHQGLNLDRISGRRGLDLGDSGTIGDKQMAVDPFAPGVREHFELDNGNFLPVSLASESGRAAFVPINRGREFFDRYANADETNTLSPTTWNEYTVGARQCAMNLDITQVVSATDPTPTELTFRYLKGGVRTETKLNSAPVALDSIPSGFEFKVNEIYPRSGSETRDVFDFDTPHDVLYGGPGNASVPQRYFVIYNVTGRVIFSNGYFGDPTPGVGKRGYARPSVPRPFGTTLLHDVRQCVTLYPERFPAYLASLGADGPDKNNSISINVDYIGNKLKPPGNPFIVKPSLVTTDLDYGVVLKECGNLSAFAKGFSVVTNLRLYIADDFNTSAITPPAEWTDAPDPFYPPCSLFAPEKRYGGEHDPLRLKISGQMGSLAGAVGDGQAEVNLLDMTSASETAMGHSNVEVNLAPITHPAALPPITMMNWLVVVEERRREFYAGTQVVSTP